MKWLRPAALEVAVDWMTERRTTPMPKETERTMPMAASSRRRV